MSDTITKNSMDESGCISVQMENIFPLIKKWLYSDKDIFVRELVTNALDAVNKLKTLNVSGEFAGLGEGESYEIRIKIDRENKTLTFSDNGIGMTGDEVKKYINEVAFSGASDFMEKYKGGEEQNQIIGHFGLGFYSSFMVSSLVEIQSLSYQADAKPILWSCDGSPNYHLCEGVRTSRGTDVILHIASDEEDFLDEFRIRHVLDKYCSFMPVPIFLNDIRINEQKALWLEKPGDLKDEDYIAFYKHLYPFEEDPIFWVHINTEFPVRAQGILYFPRVKNDYDPNRSKIKFYYNQVYVSDNLKDLIPDFLMNLRGVLDCPDMPLNVSRSYLQQDGTMKKLSSHITRKAADELLNLFKNDRERYEKNWPDLSPFIKIGMMENEKFYDIMKDGLIVKTASGGYMTFTQCLEKEDKKFYYASDQALQSFYINLFKEQNIDVLIMDSWIDTHFIQFLEMKNRDMTFARVDSEVHDGTVDSSAASSIVDPRTNKTFAQTMEEFFSQSLNHNDLTVKLEYLKSPHIPAMIMLSETQRRMQEMTALIQRKLPESLSEHTLIVNGNSPIIKNLKKMMEKLEPPQEEMNLIAGQVYDLALFSQKALTEESAESYVERAQKFLEIASDAMLK